jgi:hypothetical protein
MSTGQVSNKNLSSMCCGPWFHHRRPTSKMKTGLLLVAIGLLWLGAAMGWIDLSWMHGIPFWPAVFILFGLWLVFKGSTRGEAKTILTEKGRKRDMEATFMGMMEGCMKGMPEEDRKKMMAFCGEKMAAICPCMGTKGSDEERKAMMEKMMAFCGGKMEQMSACFGKQEPASVQTGSPQ